MAIEKKWPLVSPKLLTANGGQYGQIQIADTRGFKVKQRVTLSATSLPKLTLEVKRVLSETVLILGETTKPIQDRTSDLSAYTIALGAFVYAEEQDKATLTKEDRLFATYDQEPTVAWRTVMVDQLGRYYETANPLPVRLSDGSINIGTVNAELEVALSHKDNTPDAGDVADSVRVGDGEDEMEVNQDGSINTNVVNTLGFAPFIENISVTNANQEYSFTFPAKTVRLLMKVRDGLAKMKFAWISGESSTKYISMSMGSSYNEDGLNLSGKTIYFQTNKANQIVELMYWTQDY